MMNNEFKNTMPQMNTINFVEATSNGE